MTTMNPFDLVVLIIVVLSTFWGGMRGIISQVGAVAAWIVGLIVSARYYSVFVPMVPVSDQFKVPCATFVAFAVAFIVVSIATRFLKKTISLAGFKEFDRQIGALFGLLKGAVLCMAITFFCVLANDKTREVVDSSKSGAFFIGVIANVQDAFPDSELKTKFAEVAASLKHTEEHKAVSDEVESLKKYLMTHVFTTTAAEVVKEADEEEKAEVSGDATPEKNTSLFQRFVDGARSLNQKVESQINRTTPNVALDDSTRTNGSTNATGSYQTTSRSDYGASASNANVATSKGAENSANEENGLQRFWNTLGASAIAPLATTTQQAQTQDVQTPATGATFDDYTQGNAAESAAETNPQVGYGAYRTRASTSSSRLRSYRYSTVGPSNY